MEAPESGHVSSPNKLRPEVLEGYFTRLLTDGDQVSDRDLEDLHDKLTGQLTEEQAACLRASKTAIELGRRAELIRAGMSPLLVLDEVIGRRLAMQLDRMGYRGRKLVIYEAGGGRHELSILDAIKLLPLCRELHMPSTVALTGIEIAPGSMTADLSTFPIIELHSFSFGPGAPPVEAISPTITTGKFIQFQALSVTKASEIAHIGGSVVASGHGGVRSRQYDGLTVDAGLPGYCVRRGCSCTTEEAKAWARQNLPPPPDSSGAGPPPDAVVFLCRVVGNARRYPVLSTAGVGDDGDGGGGGEDTSGGIFVGE